MYNTVAPRIQNTSGDPQTIAFPIALSTSLELHPVGADIILETNVFLGASQLRIHGGNGRRIILGTNAMISGSGAVVVNQDSTLSFAGRMQAYTGDTIMNAGVLEIVSWGPTNTGYIRLGAVSGNEPAAIVIGPGAAVSGRIDVRAGSTGRKILGSSATAGIASISNNLTLAAPLLVTNAPGGVLRFAAPITVTGQTITISNLGNVGISNTISSTAGTGTLVKAGSGLLTLGGNLDNANLHLVLREGTVVLAKASSGEVRTITGGSTIFGTLILDGTGNDQISNTAPVVLVGGTFDLNGRTEMCGSVSGFGVISNSASSNATLQVGQNNAGTTFSGRIVDGHLAKVAYTKRGMGTNLLTGTNTYTGLTAASAGRLIVTPASKGAGEYSVSDNATLGVLSIPNGSLHMSRLTFALSSTLDITVGSWSELQAPPVQVAGILNAPSSTTINVAGGDFAVGQFPLIRYGSRSGYGVFGVDVRPAGVTATIVDNTANKTIDLNITAVVPLTWTGAQNSNWDAAVQNWKQGSTPFAYSETAGGGRMVRFDDSATGSTSLILNTNASPIALVVSNTAKVYSMRGPGRILGHGSLTKRAAGKLTLESTLANEYTGKTFITGGVLEIHNSNSLGSAASGTEVNGGTLEVRGGVATSEPLTLAGAGASSQGALHNQSGTNVFLGPIAMSTDTFVHASAGLLLLGSVAQIQGDGAIVSAGGEGVIVLSNGIAAQALLKTGGGSVSLLGSNALESITINAGSLCLDGTNSGAGLIDVAAGGALVGTGGCAGAVNVMGILSPGVGCASFVSGSELWNSGGGLKVDMADVAGQPAAGWDQIGINGGLDLRAVAGAPFTIHLASSSGAFAGPCSNFSPDTAGQWTIAAVTQGITNFNQAALSVDPVSFSNDMAGGVFDVIKTDSELRLRFTPNRAPNATDVTCVRSVGMPHKIAIADLLAGYTSDPDGDRCALESVGTPAAGGTVLKDDTWIYYLPGPADEEDSFSFTVRDIRPYRQNDTVRSVTATVTITTHRPGGSVQIIVMSGGEATIQFAGIPGYLYDVERSTDLNAWTVLDTMPAPADGVFTFVDANPPMPSAYYRLRQH